MKFALIMPAAGRGVRLGGSQPKALLELSFKPLFVWSAEPFLKRRECAEAVIAVPADLATVFEELAAQHFGHLHVRVVAGGSERQNSVGNALRALESDAELVLVHDAARPLVSQTLIDRVLAAILPDVTAVVPGVPISVTVREVDARQSVSTGTLDRARLVAVQTPQALRRSVFVEAMGRADAEGFVGTDDAALIERYGMGAVRVVEGEERNLKITTAHDVAVARFLLEQGRGEI